MKTKCYCVCCSKHPLHQKYLDSGRKMNVVTGFMTGQFIHDSDNTGKDVECLDPISDAFDELGLIESTYEYPITAYGDGSSETGFVGNSYIIYAHCDNEDYKGKQE
jgi:hypothetical protein